MPLIPKPNYNQIFASQAPDIDKPAVFNNYPLGWGVESRPNNGKPTIKGFNYLQQTSDLKDLWILQNGAALPYDATMEYAENAHVVKDGELQKKQGASWISAANKGYNLDYFVSGKSYPLHAEIMLTNGDVVKSIVSNNIIDPNVDMTGWIKTNAASQIFDKSGKDLQQINNILGAAYFIEMWSAKGDGVTDDSASIQAAINDLSALFISTGQEQTLLFNGSKTYVCRSIALKAGVHYQGVNGRAKIKKTPAGLITDEAVLKWWRIFSVSQNEASFNTDSARKVRHRFENLIFDGNRDNMNWSGGYAQEQAASLFLTGNVSSMLTSADQRNKFQVDNCLFVNSVADGIGVWYNADVIVNNVEAINCFRGGLVASGGNTNIFVDGYVGTNARIDFEVDAFGFGGTHKFSWNLNNVEIDKRNPNPSGFNGSDLCVADGGKGVGNNINIYSTPVNFNGRGLVASNPLTKLEFNQCMFYMGTGTNGNYIWPCNTDFNFVEFVATGGTGSTASAFSIGWAVTGGESIKNKVINFNDCTFLHHPTVEAAALNYAVNSQRITNQTTGNVMRFRRCHILSSFSYGVSSNGLVKIDWDGGEINAVTAFRSLYAYNDSASLLRIGNYLPLASNVRMLETNTAQNAGVINEIEFSGTVLPLEKSGVFVPTAAGVTGQVDKKVGNRTILSDTPPVAAMSAYNGDILKLNKVPVSGAYEWVCTTANFSNAGNTWRPTKWNVGSFTTVTLPVLTAFDVGVQNIDTTLNKIVTWTGSVWI